mgnify:CR=1 FL=1
MISRNLFVESKKLRVFDFDDTLFRSGAMIGVQKPGKPKRYLSSHEYATYVPDEDEEFAMSEEDGSSDFKEEEEYQQIEDIISKSKLSKSENKEELRL